MPRPWFAQKESKILSRSSHLQTYLRQAADGKASLIGASFVKRFSALLRFVIVAAASFPWITRFSSRSAQGRRMMGSGR